MVLSEPKMLRFKSVFYTYYGRLQPLLVSRAICNESTRYDTVKMIASNPSRNYSALRQLHKSKEKQLIVNASTDETSDDGPAYKVIDAVSPKIVPMLVAAKSRSSRYKKHIILLEGKRLITEALNANIVPIMIFFSRKQLLDDLPLEPHYTTPAKTILCMIPFKQMKLWSDLTTSPGIFGIFKMPNLKKNVPQAEPIPLTLVLDNIREPGNLGSILRVAAAIPVHKVIILTGCTDLWDPKVIRGSSGAMFHLTIENAANWEDVEEQCKGQILLADHMQKSYESFKPTIRAEDGIDNVEDPEAVYENEDDDDITEKTSEDVRQAFILSSKTYFEMNFKKNQSYVLIVGGETEGLSENAFRFAASRKGLRINIPLTQRVNSLNAATALGIIAFEIKRQLVWDTRK